jgi:hypothetical protein
MAELSTGVQWFTTENLGALLYDTTEEMIELLQSRALAEGFRLCCTATKSNNWNKLTCFRHGGRDEDCQFHICIQLGTKPNCLHPLWKSRLKSCDRSPSPSASDMDRLLPKLKQWRLTLVVGEKHMTNFTISCPILPIGF